MSGKGQSGIMGLLLLRIVYLANQVGTDSVQRWLCGLTDVRRERESGKLKVDGDRSLARLKACLVSREDD